MGLFFETNGSYGTTAARLVTVKKFFDANPDGRLKTGIWTSDTWTKEEFYKWFMKRLFEKCGGSKLTGKELDKIIDGRKINDYIGKRLRSYGSGLLRSAKFQRMYPHINVQRYEE